MGSDPSSSSFLHPASGVLILGLDWLLFSGSVLSLGFSTPAMAALGFVLGALGTGLIQTKYGDDTRLMTIFKGVLSGIAVGIPLPIAGTAAGGAVIALSGLDRLTGRSSKKIEEKDDNSRK